MLSFSVFLKSRKYLVSALFYLALSFLFSTWITYIPYVCEKLQLSEGRFGGALFFSAVGSFLMIPIAPRLITRFGVGRMSLIGLIYFSISTLLPILAFDYVTLCVGLFLLGSGSCLFNISINALTGTIEKGDDVMIMSGSHGFFSAGGMIGASLGGFVAAKLDNPLLHYGIVILFFISLQLYSRKYYWNIKGAAKHHERVVFSAFKPLFLVAFIGLIMMVAEGAIADWSALYLKNVVLVHETLLGFGYGAFALFMTVGRFLGDWVSHKYGSWQIISGGTLFSLFGFALVLTAYPVSVILGFAVVGLGFSAIVPEIFRIASKTHSLPTSAGVSFIAGASNVGFLIGPVLLGFLAELRSLRFSYLALTGFVFVAVVLSGAKLIRERR